MWFFSAPHYIDTIDQLNDRISNLSSSLHNFYGNDEIYDISDNDGDDDEMLKGQEASDEIKHITSKCSGKLFSLNLKFLGSWW